MIFRPVRPTLSLAATACLGVAILTPTGSATAQARGAGAGAGAFTQTRDYAMYEPAKPTPGACAPLAVISRGLGAGNSPMRSLATALSQDGWRVVVMRHPEGSRSMFEGRLVRSGRLLPKTGDETDPVSLRRRADAIDGAINMARKSCVPPFMALIGHAGGSTTTLIEGGAQPRFAVPAKDRFGAYVAISPAGGTSGVFNRDSWKTLAKPTLVVTGTRDIRVRGGWRPRTAAYEGMAPGSKRLAIVNNATHIALGGLGSPAVRLKVARIVVDFVDDARRGELKADPVAGVEFKEK